MPEVTGLNHYRPRRLAVEEPERHLVSYFISLLYIEQDTQACKILTHDVRSEPS